MVINLSYLSGFTRWKFGPIKTTGIVCKSIPKHGVSGSKLPKILFVGGVNDWLVLATLVKLGTVKVKSINSALETVEDNKGEFEHF